MSTPAVAVYIQPQSHHFLEDRLFAVENAALCGDDILAPFVAVRDYLTARGVPVHTADRLPESRAKRNLYVSLGMRDGLAELASRRDVVLSAFFAIECPIVEPDLYRALPRLQGVYKRLFSWSDDEALRPLTRRAVRLERFFNPQSFDDVHEGLWSRRDRRFLVMMNANKRAALNWRELYSERLRAVGYFAAKGEIDLYGKGWDGPPFRLGYGGLPGSLQRLLRGSERAWRRLAPDPLHEAARAAWKGTVLSKSETLSAYRFAICFENTMLKGYITEKIFDCFFAGVVPIYLGAPDIAEHVPPDSFIDMRRFGSYDELRAYLRGLSDDDVERIRQCGRDFVASDAFAPFRKAAFVDIFRRIVEEDAGVSV